MLNSYNTYRGIVISIREKTSGGVISADTIKIMTNAYFL